MLCIQLYLTQVQYVAILKYPHHSTFFDDFIPRYPMETEKQIRTGNCERLDQLMDLHHFAGGGRNEVRNGTTACHSSRVIRQPIRPELKVVPTQRTPQGRGMAQMQSYPLKYFTKTKYNSGGGPSTLFWFVLFLNSRNKKLPLFRCIHL